MKRIKVMLTGFAVVALVGGALAFKAQKFAQVCYYEDTNAHPNPDCPFIAISAITTAQQQGTGVFATTTNALPSGLCPAAACPVQVTTGDE